MVAHDPLIDTTFTDLLLCLDHGPLSALVLILAHVPHGDGVAFVQKALGSDGGEALAITATITAVAVTAAAAAAAAPSGAGVAFDAKFCQGFFQSTGRIHSAAYAILN